MEKLYGTPFLARMPRGKPRSFFNITPQTLQTHPNYPWGVWESMEHSGCHEEISNVRDCQGDVCRLHILLLNPIADRGPDSSSGRVRLVHTRPMVNYTYAVKKVVTPS